MPNRSIVLARLNKTATVRLSIDDRQWLLEVRKATRPIPGKDTGYRARSFIASNKRILLRRIRESDREIDDHGRRILAALPDTYGECWRIVTILGATAYRADLHQRMASIAPVPEVLVTPRATWTARTGDFRSAEAIAEAQTPIPARNAA